MRRFAPGVYDPEKDVWELFHCPTTSRRRRTWRLRTPTSSGGLQDLWWQEAERSRALPLLAGFSIFFGILPPLPTITRFPFRGDVQNVQRGMVPRIAARSYAIEAELSVPDGGAEGVIVANADFIGGFGLWPATANPGEARGRRALHGTPHPRGRRHGSAARQGDDRNLEGGGRPSASPQRGWAPRPVLLRRFTLHRGGCSAAAARYHSA